MSLRPNSIEFLGASGLDNIELKVSNDHGPTQEKSKFFDP